MPYNIYIKYKRGKQAVLNITFGNNGDIYVSDLISTYSKKPIYHIYKYDLPLDDRRFKKIKLSTKPVVTTVKPKFSHHISGQFHVSSNTKEKLMGPKVDSFRPNEETNDMGPFMTGKFWGINKLPLRKSKTSKQIVFTDGDINDQGFYNSGKKIAFVLLFFHIPLCQLSNQEALGDWMEYSYKNFKRPLILKVLKDTINNGYIVGISCLKARCDDLSDYGYTISGGPGLIDEDTGTCENVSVTFSESAD